MDYDEFIDNIFKQYDNTKNPDLILNHQYKKKDLINYYEQLNKVALSEKNKKFLYDEYLKLWKRKYDEYFDDLKESIKQEEFSDDSDSDDEFYDTYPKFSERELLEQKLWYARNYIDNNVKNNKVKTSKKQMFKLSDFKNLTDDEKELLYKEYEQKWYNEHPEKIVVKKDDTFTDKLKKYVVEHTEDMLTLEEFEKLTKYWNRGRKSINEWYETYKSMFFKQPGTNFQYPVKHYNINKDNFLKRVGFKSKNKVESLYKQQFNEDIKYIPEPEQKNYFPTKDNKKYQLHKVASKGTYLIDLMFSNKLCYLIAINVNTKYLYAELTNIIENTDNPENFKVRKDNKSAILYLKALQKMIDSGMKVKHLSGDGESAFNSKLAWESLYKKYNIDFKPVPRQNMGIYPDFMQKEQKATKTDPMHGSLGIIDRVIRTIRDMAYNMKIGVINPNAMKIIVEQYNNAPHRMLTTYAGFETTPKMVENNDNLEEYIVKRILQKNFNIKNENGFNLAPGTNVSIYNEKDSLSKRRSIVQPGNHKIDSFENGYYKVVDNKNKIQLVPRYKINPIY